MALAYSTMMELGSQAPSFTLPIANPEGDNEQMRSLDDFTDGKALVLVFMCNHCPFVIHVEDALLAVARTYQKRGVRFVAISSNDAEQYPDDSFENMALRAKEKEYPFPYLYDESQEVAHAYSAVCTPDFFVYDAVQKLAYRGRFDATRPGMGRAHGGDVCRALDELLDTGSVAMPQAPSMGCNIKWK